VASFFGRFFRRDVGIDLGTANTLIYERGKGIVLDEPSVVAVDTETGAILAVGAEAKRMIGRTPVNIEPIRPLHDGVIADFELTEAMLRTFLERCLRITLFSRPRVVICAPSGVTQVERKAVRDVANTAGARESYIIDELMAAAIGAGLPVNEALGSMVVDVGAGTTEVGVISLGGCVYVSSNRVAGNTFDDAVRTHLKQRYSFLIGPATAEEVKKRLGFALLPDDSNRPIASEVKHTEISGRDLLTGLPKKVSVSEIEVAQALIEPINHVLDAVREALEKTPPELASDIAEGGITLTGGGALIRDLDKLISLSTDLPVRVADAPLTCVVRGTAVALDELDTLSGLTSTSS